MIFGVGHDIVINQRIRALYTHYGRRFSNKILSSLEQAELLKFSTENSQVSYLAKRFVAKEAFAKACGTGIRPPVLMPNISIVNDSLGKPRFIFSLDLQVWLDTNKITRALVSITDESVMSSAFVILE